MSCTNCGDKTLTCGSKIYAPCVFWEVPDSLMDDSSLGNFQTNPLGTTSECVSIDEVIEDIYPRLEDVEDDIDSLETAINFDYLTSDCLGIDADDDPSLKDVINGFNTKICELDDVCNILQKEISECNIDFSCFGDDSICGDPLNITTLEDLLQEMIDRICTLENA